LGLVKPDTIILMLYTAKNPCLIIQAGISIFSGKYFLIAVKTVFK
jgi:hypothetical protein